MSEKIKSCPIEEDEISMEEKLEVQIEHINQDKESISIFNTTINVSDFYDFAKEGLLYLEQYQ